MQQELSIIYIENPTPEQIKEYQNFADVHWGEHYNSPEEIKENFFDIPKYIFLAKYEDKLVGLCFIYIRTTIFIERTIKFAGIGGVVTHSDYRHRGIATKLLENVVSKLKEWKVDIALLSTDIPKLGGLYKRIGFVPLNKSYLYKSKSGLDKEDTDGMIANISSVDAFEEILKSSEPLNVGISNF